MVGQFPLPRALGKSHFEVRIYLGHTLLLSLWSRGNSTHRGDGPFSSREKTLQLSRQY